MKKSAQNPEAILYNGLLATELSGASFIQALAVGGGKILALGSDADMHSLAGPDTEKIDLEGRLVLPGFIDSHIHFYEWSLKRQDLKLDGLTNLEELLDLVRKDAAGKSAGEWIMGQGWNETDWTDPRMPTREVLDLVAPDHPVLLWRCDLHLAAANSVALQMADISPKTPDPPDGRIERDPAGEPTGILRELAINLVRQAVKPPDPSQVIHAFKDGIKALHRRGITAIHDIRLMADTDGASALQTFQLLDQDKSLDLRCWVSLPGHELDKIIALGFRTGFGNDRLRIGHVKFFSDGGMGARTAWLIDPYLDAECGMPLMDMELLAREIEKADHAGLSVMVHAVGDRANQELINIYTNLKSNRLTSKTPPPNLAHRIEHVQMIQPQDADRLRSLGVALCVTPANMVLDMNLIDTALGDSGKWTYSFRRLIDSGAPVIFSSDCPVCDPDPLLGIHAAVTRQRPDGTPEGGWWPESRVTVAEALKAYTETPAIAHNAPDIGTIAMGKRADLAVLSHDIFEIPAMQIAQSRVDMTVFDGRIVFRNF
jgi:predicted amidohydrolase YtcJ